MAPNPRIVLERLEALYERLPQVRCRGLCAAQSCGKVAASIAEHQRLAAAGEQLGVDARGACSLLDGAGSCRAYDHRPLICRAWGATRGTRCGHGCEIIGEPLDDEQLLELLLESLEIGGRPAGAPSISRTQLRATLERPEIHAAWRRLVDAGAFGPDAAPLSAYRDMLRERDGEL